MSSALITLEVLATRLPPRGRLFGLDLGTKTIGVAVSDVERRLSTPVETIQRVKFGKDAQALIKLADVREAIGFVIGLPLNMDGSEGPRAQATRAFVRSRASRPS